MRHTKTRKDNRGVTASHTIGWGGFLGLQTPAISFDKPAKSEISVTPLFFPESASDIQEVNRCVLDSVWRWPRLDEEFATIGDIVLRYRDVKTLREDGWLNDEVMNAYVNLLSQHCPEVLLLNTFFVEILKQRSHTGALPLEKIHRILHRKGVDSIFDRQKVIVPVNIENRHWVCYCIDHDAEEIAYFDSLRLPEPAAGDLLEAYLGVEMEHMGLVGKKKYRRERAVCARQFSGSDCGVFALVNIRNCAMRVPLEAEQGLMHRIRRMITLELQQGRIL